MTGVTDRISFDSPNKESSNKDSLQKNPVRDSEKSDPSVLEVDEIQQALNTNISTGLTSQEAQRRLEQFGPNQLASAPPVPKWKKFLAQFQDPLVYLLLAATVISLIAWFIERAYNPTEAEALPFDCIVIVLILIVNAVLGYIQENRAEESVQALARMTAPQTTVLRDGQVASIDTTELVPGDVLVIGEGDTVAADGRLFSAASLRVAEASLTGESLPVAKKVNTLEKLKSLGDRTNMVFNGTSVTQGTGRAIVTSTGMKTQVGKIADMLSQTKEDQTPLEKEMDNVTKVLGTAVVIIAVVVILALVIVEGFSDFRDVIDSLLLAVSLAVAAVPEGLATILTVVLALGVQRMAKHNAIVKELSSVETLGSASVICSDKTGTLTRNEMTVETVITAGGEYTMTGTGYTPVGKLLTKGNGSELERANWHEAVVTLGAGFLANNAQLRKSEESDEWEIVGDPTEAALLVASRKIKADEKYSSFERVAEIPFTSERKMQSVIARNSADDDRLSAFAKGAPDVLLERCSKILVGDAVRPLTDGTRQEILANVERLSSDAYRTLGQAYRPLEVHSLAEVSGISTDSEGQVDDISEQSDVIECDYIWTGMVGIIDPPRTEVADSIAQAHRAGIRTVMITGDHPLTAARIASDLGIIDKQNSYALTGDELDAMSDAEFDKATSEVSVYARVAPEHKLRIVESLQKQGNVAAMTGDGVNDAPAVKTADIGVAMGITGTEVTKESAAMILADDNFSTIVSAVREGRVIFDNIRKFLRYLLSSNVGEVFTVFFGVVLAGFLGISNPESTGVTVPLLATQLLWINLLTDAAPALAMGVDGETEDVMSRQPRHTTDRVIDTAMWIDIAFIGIVMAAVTLIGMDLYLPGGLFTDNSMLVSGTHEDQMVMARTMGFTILVFAQLFNALASRSAERSAFGSMFTNKWLWGAIVLSIVLQLGVIYIPALNTAFGTTPLHWHQWFEALGLAAGVLVASEIYKFIVRMIHRTRKRQEK